MLLSLKNSETEFFISFRQFLRLVFEKVQKHILPHLNHHSSLFLKKKSIRTGNFCSKNSHRSSQFYRFVLIPGLQGDSTQLFCVAAQQMTRKVAQLIHGKPHTCGLNYTGTKNLVNSSPLTTPNLDLTSKNKINFKPIIIKEI